MTRKEKVRIAVFVSGGGTNFQAILDAMQSGIINDGEVKLVFADRRDVYALERAKKAGIDTVTIPKLECKDMTEFEQKLLIVLEEYDIELIILAGFLTVLSAEFTKMYDRRIINVHPSLIPAFCGHEFYGLAVHEAALSRGVKLTGATVHFVNEITDGGEIIAQKAVEVKPGDTPEILQKRVMEQAEWILLPEAVQMVSHEIRNREE